MMEKNTELGRRLTEIVEIVFGGNASLAAAAAGMAPPAFYRLNTGQVENPRLGTIQALAEAFGVTLGWLVGDKREDIEPYWLLISYYRGVVQRRSRDWLRQNSALIKPSWLLVSADWDLITLSAGPLIDISNARPSRQEIALVRQLLVAESEILELAVTRFKKESRQNL